MPEFLTITALLGKADATFRYGGGSAIVFNFLRTYIFGKVLRTIEYPDGDLHSVRIHRSSMHRLKTSIAMSQPPLFPTAFISAEDVKQVALWISPHFTEKVSTDSHVWNLPDGCWLMWSKYSEAEQAIPRRGVKLEGPQISQSSASGDQPKDTRTSRGLQRDLLDLATKLTKEGILDRSTSDVLIYLIAEKDPAILALGSSFMKEPREFARHAVELISRRNLRSTSQTQQVSNSDDIQQSPEPFSLTMQPRADNH